MKLLRYGMPGHEKPGALDAAGKIRDLSQIVSDIGGDALLPQSIGNLSRTDLAKLRLVEDKVRLGPCVRGVGKFVCIGLNHSDHAAESGTSVPTEPVLFMML